MGVLQELDAVTNLATKTKRGIGETWTKNWKYRKYPYYFNSYNKKTYVDKNGNGIVFMSCEIVVVDKIKTTYIKAKMDISDAKFNTKFPSFKKLKESRGRAFEDFWFDAWSTEKDLITAIKEDYSILPSNQASRYKNSDKHLCIKISLNNNLLKKNRAYKIFYMFSIPGMFPIANGYYNTKSSVGGSLENCVSSLDIEEFCEKCKVSIYLSKDITLDGAVEGFASKSGVEEEKLFEVQYEDFGFYTKNTMVVNKANKYRSVGFKLVVKEEARMVDKTSLS